MDFSATADRPRGNWLREAMRWGLRAQPTDIVGRSGWLARPMRARPDASHHYPLGYTDPLYFSRAFHKFHGCSPNDARSAGQAETAVGQANRSVQGKERVARHDDLVARTYPPRTSSGN